jgi:hypothetical protein
MRHPKKTSVPRANQAIEAEMLMWSPSRKCLLNGFLRRCASLPNVMIRPPDRRLLGDLAAYDPNISNLTLALRELVLEEAPEAIESIVKSYAVAIGFSFTGKPLKDGFCHIVTYATHVNLGFNRGAQLSDPNRILVGKGKSIRHVTIKSQSELENPVLRRYLRAAIEQVTAPRSTMPARDSKTAGRRPKRMERG